MGGIVDSSLAISEDGKLYYGCYDGSLYCINLDAGPAESDWSMFKRNAMRDGAWPSYSLEISLNNPDYGIVSGDGVHNPGATVHHQPLLRPLDILSIIGLVMALQTRILLRPRLK